MVWIKKRALKQPKKSRILKPEKFYNDDEFNALIASTLMPDKFDIWQTNWVKGVVQKLAIFCQVFLDKTRNSVRINEKEWNFHWILL